jgi:hypothetical protein
MRAQAIPTHDGENEHSDQAHNEDVGVEKQERERYGTEHGGI